MSDVLDRPHVGALLRSWRTRRNLSQLDLALEANVSARHVSFVETGRSRPSAEMVVHLAEQLQVPLRDRNQLLLAAGYAPVYGQRDLDEPAMGPVREVVERVLAAHEPFPALVVDRHWGMVLANAPVRFLTAASPSTCSSRRSTSCGSACIPKGSPRASSTSASGARTCSTAWPARRRPAATRPSPPCARSSPATLAACPPRAATRSPARSRCRCGCATRRASWPSSAR